MNTRVIVKNIIENIPYRIGSIISKVPFSLRLGKEYTSYLKLIDQFKVFTHEEKNKYIVDNFNNIFQYAKNKFPFYRNLYEEAGVLNLEIRSMSDIDKIPIISKSQIRNSLKDFTGALKINTGGTSGEPFAFYVDKNAFSREWAHMHSIWALKGYSFQDLKLTLRGKDLGKQYLRYNAVHNEYLVNTYKSVAENKSKLESLLKKRNIKYIHGYPSAIFNFLKELEIVMSDEEIVLMKKNIRSCFLGSEFPTPVIKQYLSDVWGLDYISWYGHSEMCILAYDENKDNKYKPFFTYGFPEVVNNQLLGTSYHNFDMPLIRYNTGDLVEPSYSSNGLLETFSITQGREGDFVEDKSGNKIPLTSLIFGRHHKAFDLVNHIQVSQNTDNGRITFYLISNNTSLLKHPESLLNLDNVNIDYDIKLIKEPFRTKAGKVKLKID